MKKGWGCQGERERSKLKGHREPEMARLGDWVTGLRWALGWKRDVNGL